MLRFCTILITSFKNSTRIVKVLKDFYTLKSNFQKEKKQRTRGLRGVGDCSLSLMLHFLSYSAQPTHFSCSCRNFLTSHCIASTDHRVGTPSQGVLKGISFFETSANFKKDQVESLESSYSLHCQTFNLRRQTPDWEELWGIIAKCFHLGIFSVNALLPQALPD